jgi:NAD(P)-dependent dehydrogenase (short-subunit alcohol dehydrogenase family)
VTAARGTGGVCVVAGVGPGNGAALTRRFAEGGYRVAMLARSAERLADLEREVGGARAYAVDVTDRAAVESTFAAISGISRTRTGRRGASRSIYGRSGKSGERGERPALRAAQISE